LDQYDEADFQNDEDLHMILQNENESEEDDALAVDGEGEIVYDKNVAKPDY
jgi:hypothetical protein